MNDFNHNLRVWISLGIALLCSTPGFAQDRSLSQTIESIQPRIVKIFGSGGFRGLEPYQSAFAISNDGHLLTAWSYVLDSDKIIATLHNGQRYEATLVGYDPRVQIAILKIEVTDLPAFDIEDSKEARPGTPVLAFSNLYRVATGNEPASVLQGIISARTKTSIRSGAMQSAYDGEVLILDAMTNNPGAAGGAVTDWNGRLIGMIGKEQKESDSGTWLNYAIPIDELRDSVGRILAGQMIVEQNDPDAQMPAEPMTLELLGIRLVPEVVSRTPPFVDDVTPNSPAAISGIVPDDLIVEVNGKMTPSVKSVIAQLRRVDRDRSVSITIQRDRKFKQIELRTNR